MQYMEVFSAADLASMGLEVPDDYSGHRWTTTPGSQVRNCYCCGQSEMAWEDLAYPYNPCPATQFRDADREEVIHQHLLDAFYAQE